MTLLAKIVRRGPADVLMAAEAMALLLLFRVCLALVPVRTIIGTITRGRVSVKPGGGAETMRDLSQSTGAERVLQVARKVQWAVTAVARHSPVEFVCFPQSLAAYTMLRWRKVPGTIVYGVARSPEGELIGHTWLESGDGIVTGGAESVGFAPVARWS